MQAASTGSEPCAEHVGGVGGGAQGARICQVLALNPEP